MCSPFKTLMEQDSKSSLTYTALPSIKCESKTVIFIHARNSFVLDSLWRKYFESVLQQHTEEPGKKMPAVQEGLEQPMSLQVVGGLWELSPGLKCFGGYDWELPLESIAAHHPKQWYLLILTVNTSPVTVIWRLTGAEDLLPTWFTHMTSRLVLVDRKPQFLTLGLLQKLLGDLTWQLALPGQEIQERRI